MASRFLHLLSEERLDPEAVSNRLSPSASDSDLVRRRPHASRARNRVAWVARLGLQIKHAPPAPKGACHFGRRTMPSIGSAIASGGMLSDTDRCRGHLVFRPRRVSKTHRKGAVSSPVHRASKGACYEPGRQRASFSRRPYFRFSSFDKSDRKSASARFPANSAAISDWNPSAVILMPNGLLLRHISQPQRSGYSPRREVVR